MESTFNLNQNIVEHVHHSPMGDCLALVRLALFHFLVPDLDEDAFQIFICEEQFVLVVLVFAILGVEQLLVDGYFLHDVLKLLLADLPVFLVELRPQFHN